MQVLSEEIKERTKPALVNPTDQLELPFPPEEPFLAPSPSRSNRGISPATRAVLTAGGVMLTLYLLNKYGPGIYRYISPAAAESSMSAAVESSVELGVNAATQVMQD